LVVSQTILISNRRETLDRISPPVQFSVSWNGRHKETMLQQKFSVPQEIEEILDRLPPHVTLSVPDHVLSGWFSRARSDAALEEIVIARVEGYARSCGCQFRYGQAERAGIFYKSA
jgi:hypothetical protein